MMIFACCISYTFVTEFKLFFHKVSIINTLFLPTLSETQDAGRVKVYAEASELFTHAVFQLVILRKTASSEFILHRTRGCKTVGAESGL